MIKKIVNAVDWEYNFDEAHFLKGAMQNKSRRVITTDEVINIVIRAIMNFCCNVTPYIDHFEILAPYPLVGMDECMDGEIRNNSSDWHN